jgi:hypothetical protein
VYLFPLILPHLSIFFGQAIWQELTRGERERLWVVTDIGFALILQLLAFAALYGLFKEPSKLRVAMLVVAVPLGAITVEFAYLVAIPSLFLIEKDTALERGDWKVECAAREVAMVDIPHPSSSVVWNEVPVQAHDGTYKLMRIPGCSLAPFPVPQPTIQAGGRVDFTIGLNYFVPGHGIIFSKQETATGAFTWNAFSNGRITSIPGLHASAVPILSLDGEWAAWMERESIDDRANRW